MAALTDLSDIINRLTGGNSGTPEHLWFWKNNFVDGTITAGPIALRFYSLWRKDSFPSGGLAPGAAAVTTNTTVGGLWQANPGSGRQKWLVAANVVAASPGTLTLYDRLAHVSGLSGASTSPQAAGLVVDRYTGSESIGNQIWLEIYTQIGATSRTVTAVYVNQDGDSATTEAAIIGGTGYREVNQLIPLTLASGDTGVREVTSITLSDTTGVVGDLGVNIVRPLLDIPFSAVDTGGLIDGITAITGTPEIKTNACLAMAWMPLSSGSTFFYGILSMIEK